MGYKMTTENYFIRQSNTVTVPVGTGTTVSTANSETIDLNLDTLSREVLLIHEVDWDVAGIAALASAVATDAAATGLYPHFVVSLQLNTEEGVFNLGSKEFIAGREIGISTFDVVDDSLPDTSNTNADYPLAIVAGSDVVFRMVVQQNLSPAFTSRDVSSFCRIVAQRAKADSDTYAAILTGLN